MATRVTVPVLFGAGNVQVPVVTDIAIAVQAGSPPPPIVKSTLPDCEVVIARTGFAPTGVAVPPPCSATDIEDDALFTVMVNCLCPVLLCESVAITSLTYDPAGVVEETETTPPEIETLFAVDESVNV